MTKDEVFEIIKKNVLEVLDDVAENMITGDKRLRDLGADSIDRAEVITLTMEDLNIKIDLNEMRGIKNIQGLVDLFYRVASGG